MPLDKTSGIIVGPSGEPINVPTVLLTAEEARLLRLYKKFLHNNGLREAIHCNSCWDGGWHDGTQAYVTDQEIVIRCRCSLRYFKGPTY